MTHSFSPRLTAQELHLLNTALHYLRMAELKNVCHHLHLPEQGTKSLLIHRITEFLTSGRIIKLAALPSASRAQKSQSYPLAPTTLMLKGAYKNDLATRMFFKHLIGAHFHFTAFGIDWLNERWREGKPPTYQEFADFWSTETAKRALMKAPPKAEWAYINFVQAYLIAHPTASQYEVKLAWFGEHDRQKKIVTTMLKIT